MRLFKSRALLVIVATAQRASLSGMIAADTSTAIGERAEQTVRAAWSGSSRADTSFPRVPLHFCLGCSDPAAEGSVVLGLAPYHGVRKFKIAADVIYAVPNNCQSELLNSDDMPDRIVLVNRGQVPIVEKVLKTQAAGASGVIVVDDGGCNSDFTDCGRLGGARAGGFAKRDGLHSWSGVRIPTLLVSRAEGQRLRGMMRLEKISVDGLGEQFVER